MTLQAYPQYKPSGVAWLSNVPAHWRVGKFAREVHIAEGQVDPEEEPFASMLLVAPNHVESRTGRLIRLESAAEQGAESGKYLCKQGDVVYSKIRPALAKVVLAPEDCLCSADMYPLRVGVHLLNAYLRWLLLSDPFIAWSVLEADRVAMPKINRDTLNELRLPTPPQDEQQAIADFLGEQTAKVDALVAKKRTLVERLKEKRTALISRAVTRGVRLSASSAAGFCRHFKLKAPGVEWLGQIPAHWDVGKFTREVAIAEGQVDPEQEPYSHMPLIGPNHVESGTGRLLALETAEDQGAESGKYLCRVGDVIYSKIRPALAKVVLANQPSLCSADMYPLRVGRRLLNRFLKWVVLSPQFTAWSILEADRVAMPKINRETLGELRLPIPPMEEQRTVADYLDVETAKLDQMAAKVDLAIERLQEHRTALITAAVTGKIDVRRASGKIQPA